MDGKRPRTVFFFGMTSSSERSESGDCSLIAFFPLFAAPCC